MLDEIVFDHDTPNESRADYGARIALCTPDWGANDMRTDIVDALADVAHYIRRVGLVPEDVFADALDSAFGDLEDGPEAAFQPDLRAVHDEGKL